jgi:hypothetical protein
MSWARRLIMANVTCITTKWVVYVYDNFGISDEPLCVHKFDDYDEAINFSINYESTHEDVACSMPREVDYLESFHESESEPELDRFNDLPF